MKPCCYGFTLVLVFLSFVVFSSFSFCLFYRGELSLFMVVILSSFCCICHHLHLSFSQWFNSFLVIEGRLGS